MSLERELQEASAKVRDLFRDRFYTATPRSEAYRRGFLASLRKFSEKMDSLRNPYQVGTADADAWWSGLDHGSSYSEFRNAA